MKGSRPARRRIHPPRSGSAAFALLVAGAGLASVASAQTITEFLIPTEGAGPLSIAAGPDGNLWFTEFDASKIGRITTAGTITEFPITDCHPYDPPYCYPDGITAGPDGNLWFTEVQGNRIGRITPDGVITSFYVPTHFSAPRGITAGPDGNLWFTEEDGNKIGCVTPEGRFAEFPVRGQPFGIAAGPDGNLWFTERVGGRIGRITPLGVSTEFDLPDIGYFRYVDGITAGPDGNLWFTVSAAGRGSWIGRITPAGVITEFALPAGALYPHRIAPGPDDSLWFTTGNSIGWITTAGVVTNFVLVPSPIAWGVVAGPDGHVWLTEHEGNRIGRVVLFDPPGAASSFYTVEPCRAFDSRESSAPLAAGTQTAVLLVGQCGVPAGATAVAVNLTVTGATTAGNIRLAADARRPLTLASTINYAAEQTRANNAVAPLGPSGATAVHVSQASGTVHVILDVSGCFAPDGAPEDP